SCNSCHSWINSSILCEAGGRKRRFCLDCSCMKKIAIDFGTTNTVVAVWRDARNAPDTVRLPGLSKPPLSGEPPLVRSRLDAENGAGDRPAGVAWGARRSAGAA